MRLTKDVLAGLMFLTFGIGAAVIAQDYSLGTLARMGSGYFPMMVGGVIAVLGLAILIRALLRPESSEPVPAISDPAGSVHCRRHRRVRTAYRRLRRCRSPCLL